MDIDTVILCGGRGSRLNKFVSDRPKAMADINGRPFLDILIDYLSSYGLNRFILCAGYMADYIERYYHSKDKGKEITISIEEHPLDTGGAIKNAQEFIDSQNFLALNGDSFCPVELDEFLKFHLHKTAILSIVASKARNSFDSGSLSLNRSCRITKFIERGRKNMKKEYFINAGIYLFRKDILSMIPNNIAYSLEYEFFPRLVGKEFFGFITRKEIIDIGTPLRYKHAKKFFCRRT